MEKVRTDTIKNRTLLFTGASGFLGKNILGMLERMFGSVTTLGRHPANDIAVDLATDEPAFDRQFDVVLHAAGMAHHVLQDKKNEKLFFDVNYGGTVKLCKALEKVGVPHSFVFVSTVAVYGCERGEMISEEHPLEGKTPYARSKIMAEEYLCAWCAAHGVVLTILRPALIAGVNPPGNLGSMIDGIRKGFYAEISGGRARKSILMAGDIVRLLPLVMDKGGVYNLCDNTHPSLGELARLIAARHGKHRIMALPYPAARLLALAGDMLGRRFPLSSSRLSKLTGSLTFSNRKATEELGWSPTSVLDSDWL